MNKTDIYIGRSVRYYRNLKGISMKDMAARLNVDCSTISRYENGKRAINLVMLTKILDTLEISFNDVFPHTTLEQINDEFFAMWWESENMLPVLPSNILLIIKKTNHVSEGDIIVTFSINRDFKISRLLEIEGKFYGLDYQSDYVVESDPLERLFGKVTAYFKNFDSNKD